MKSNTQVVDHLIVGHYGSGNLGDDIMLMELMDEFRAAGKTFRVVFFGPHYEQFGLTPDERVHLVRSSKLPYFLKLSRTLMHSKSIVWGGGTCFTDEEGDGYFLGMMVAWMLRRAIHYRAVGVGSLNRRSRFLKFLLLTRLATSMTLRDEVSLSFVRRKAPQSLEVAFEADLGKAHIKQNLDRYPISDEIPILVAWRDLTNYGISEVDPLADFVAACAPRGDAVHLIAVDSEVDRDFNVALASELRQRGLRVVFHETSSAAEKIKLIAQARQVFTARLHVLIAAMELGKEVLVYPYSKKINLELSASAGHATVFNPYDGS